MSNYRSMAKRIRDCKDKKQLDKCEDSMTRLYYAGAFTVNQFMRLDSVLVDTHAKIQLEEEGA